MTDFSFAGCARWPIPSLTSDHREGASAADDAGCTERRPTQQMAGEKCGLERSPGLPVVADAGRCCCAGFPGPGGLPARAWTGVYLRNTSGAALPMRRQARYRSERVLSL